MSAPSAALAMAMLPSSSSTRSSSTPLVTTHSPPTLRHRPRTRSGGPAPAPPPVTTAATRRSAAGKRILESPIVVLLVAAVACSALYFLRVPSGLALPLVKWLSIVPLVVTLRRYGSSSRQDLFFASGVVFHSIGDVAICVFSVPVSLPFFLLGHFFYLAAFAVDIHWRSLVRRAFSIPRAILLVAIVAYFCAFSSALLPLAPASLRVPIVLYVVVVLAMTAVGVIVRTRRGAPGGTNLIVLGIFCYVISDSLIALNEFHVLEKFLDVEIGASLAAFGDRVVAWPLYFAAQFFLVFGMLREKRRLHAASAQFAAARSAFIVDVFTPPRTPPIMNVG